MVIDSGLHELKESLLRERAEMAAPLTGDPADMMAYLHARRDRFEQENSSIPHCDDVSVTAITSGSHGEILTPVGADLTSAILYHHGGGHLFGSARSYRHLVSRLASAAGIPAYNMDYSLAPEAPYPAGLEDAVASYRYLLAQGIAPQRIVFGGDSAGANLTAALLFRIRDEGLPMPAGAYFVSSVLDALATGESYAANLEEDPWVSRESVVACMEIYRGEVAADHPLISPLMGDLTGLPPVLMQVGGNEVLLSDTLEFVKKAALAGVDVSLRVWPQMVHAWPLFHPTLTVAGPAAIKEAGDWIRNLLSRT